MYKIQGNQRKSFHQLIAGYLAGFACFGKKTSVNYQIVLYLFSRNLVGTVSHIAKKYNFGQTWETHPLLAAMCWGIVMLLYDDDKSTLQPSLKFSMDFLYTDSEKCNSWADFVPFWLPESVVKFGEKYFPIESED